MICFRVRLQYQLSSLYVSVSVTTTKIRFFIKAVTVIVFFPIQTAFVQFMKFVNFLTDM